MFYENLNVIAYMDHFVLQICQSWVEKIICFDFTVFHWAAKMKQSITIMNLETKVFILKRHRNS